MARIVGVDLPSNKRGEIALTYIYGIGRSSAMTSSGLYVKLSEQSTKSKASCVQQFR